jgi:hypothetical protein
MAYPSIASMKDALGDIVIFSYYNPKTGDRRVFLFDQLPVDAQLALFQWINQLPAIV